MACAILALIYVAVYVVWSRAAIRKAEAANLEGFYYIVPVDDRTVQWNAIVRTFFTPINEVDVWLGLGKGPGSDPLFRVSN